MKTDNIYIAELGISTNVKTTGTVRDFFYGDGITTNIKYKFIKYVLIKTERNSSCKLIGKDLNLKKEYLCEFPMEKGKLFVSPEKMLPFEAIYPDAPRNLSKRKILKMGNEAITEIIKIEEERKK